MNRLDAAALDAADPLAPLRDEFALPEGVIYLDGNSLGALPKKTAARVAEVIAREWGEGLITSWNSAGWITSPERVGAKIAPLIGAQADEVVAGDSTSVNLYKMLGAALGLRPGRSVIISERGNFPTDLYVIEGLIAQHDDQHVLRTVTPAELAGALDERVAVVVLTHVNYRTGALYDMATVTRQVHDAGALMIWDLCHSAGAVPVDLEGAQADFAVGCGYKYLNGGPGAPAFLYVARRWQDRVQPPLSGWMGHAEPFAFDDHYRPAPGIRRNLCGTPPVVALAALEVGLDIWAKADMAAVRDKSRRLGDLFIERIEARCAGHGLTLAAPRESSRRGSQVSFSHAGGYAIIQALIARGVIADFRSPDVMRFGFTPLYTRYVDVWDAAEALAAVLDSGEWDAPRFHARGAVT